jgi:uncharacterized damage-inducible protein DinB
MKWQNLVLEAFKRQTEELEKLLDGLTVEDLNRQPAPDCNSIGWLVWHVIRGIDRNMSEIMGEEQLWIKDKWHARFSCQPNPAETGYGHTVEQVKAFRSPSVSVILDYYRAIMATVEKYINNKLDEKELSREYISPTLNKSFTVNQNLAGQFWHNSNHYGAAGYVRGLLKGKGWYGR